MAASFVTSSLHLGHIATAMLPRCINELTERCYHFGLTFVIKQPLKAIFKWKILKIKPVAIARYGCAF